MASGIANSVPLINNRNRIHAVASPGNDEGEEGDTKGRGTLAWQELLKKLVTFVNTSFELYLIIIPILYNPLSDMTDRSPLRVYRKSCRRSKIST